MTSPLLAALADACASRDAPRAGEHVLVATSGGPDSMALLAALAETRAAHGLEVSAVHVDHALRGEESAGDAAAVVALAAALGIPSVIAPAPVTPGPNLEARARALRHRALRRLLRDRGADAIALAHTEDDQTETVLLRLVRGTGRRGLGGMRERSGALWRPLLGVTRADVRRFLADRGIPSRVDRSNADLRHTRNRLRRLIVPLLARELNPNLGRTIADLARRLRDEEALLDDLAGTRLHALRRDDALATAVADETPAQGRRIVRAWLDGHGATRAGAAHVDRVLALAAGRGADVALPGPMRVVREQGWLHLRAGRQDDARAFRWTIRADEPLTGPDGAWRLVVSAPRSRGAGDPGRLDARHVAFDADRLRLPLVVRSRERGDRIGLLGGGTKKVQDVLVDAKVPRERRSRCPILVDADGRIAWVAGVLRGDVAPVADDTRRIIDASIE